MAGLRALSLALLHASGVVGDFDNFPVKSISLSSAPSVAFYVSYSLDSVGLYDVHPVHGAATSDGSYVMAGKALEGDGSSFKRMFCVKLSSTGTPIWTWGHTIDSQQDAANAVLQLPNGGDIIVVGYQTDTSDSNTLKRSITKLGLSDGSHKWSAMWSSTTSGRVSAWEMAELTKDNNYVLLAGFHEKNGPSEMMFKSYGAPHWPHHCFSSHLLFA